MANRKIMLPQYGTVMKRGVLYYRTRIKDTNGKLVAIYAKTPEELYNKETLALEQIENATFHRKTPTVAEYCEKWLLMQSVHVRATTLTDYTSKVRRHIIAELGDKRMGEVSLDDIQLALVPVSKKSASVYKSVVILYKSIFRAAMESRIIDHKWLGDQAKPSHRELLRVAIDNALSQSPADFEELLKLLQEYGCEVSKRGKSYRLKLSGWEKAARMDSLGEGYGLEDLRAVLLGKKAHTPRKKTVTQAEPPKVNLLVDIQAKLQAGKGAGYARWAKVFNLKQMAQTMNYLSENNLLEYAVLEEKAAAATAHHNDLSAQIKAAEKRMAEIAVLRTHIVNYAKTREVYVAYRKAGYSKKFREEHEEEILLHQAAKNAFDEMGVKKLPKVKELQTEYAKLLEEKKKTYAEYRRSREEMRELLTAKANVDRVLKMEVEQDVEKEKDHGQR